MPIVSGQSKKPEGFSIKKAYLFAYNALSTTGWAYVLYITVSHILGGTPAPPINPTAAETARNAIQRLITKIPLTLRNATPLTQAKVQIYNAMPPLLLTCASPELAILEVVHVFLGLVRSPLGTTAMQVASRLTLVWGIVENFAETRTNPIYASMVTAWSIAEIIRYTFYALALLGYEPYIMQYIRYTAFWVNYPVGASSEAFLMLSTVPPLATLFSGSWTIKEYTSPRPFHFLVACFTLMYFMYFLSGLYIMMSHMARQRRKVLNKRKTQ
ncbi:hypothetical protein BS47DRAFT_1372006 [Hydnum rufescens UP504]|uniref:Very-long-chain (3R)-3-hydroxyacyl-CoA dehydratase n=1 Tax=Hydnum rufescens UP504 TaxID=1448309 RepID=A0A9P6DVP4_9AGAM|nr:hypothetical protein BS47DRAFT_1372006 [Hydnum rufescens UP504]